MRTLIQLFICGALCLLAVGCSSKDDGTPAESAAVPVVAAVPTVQDITVYLESIGTLHPSIFMEIRPQVSGKIVQVPVEEGQWVEEGTPLLVIDRRPYLLKAREAEAQLAIDLAALQGIEKKLERFKELVQKEYISQIEWDELNTQNAKAKATIAFDEARLANAEIDLENCTLRSPAGGRMGRLDAHPGLLVTNGQSTPLATISKMDPLLVQFSLTEKDFPKIPQGGIGIEINSLDAKDRIKKGTVTFLDNHFDEKSGQLLVRGKIDNPDFSLRPGQTIQVRVPIASKVDMILVPQRAIRYNPQGPYVYVVLNDGTVANRQLILGEEYGKDQIVLEGLDREEPIILEGHLRLWPGIKVEIKS